MHRIGGRIAYHDCGWEPLDERLGRRTLWFIPKPYRPDTYVRQM